MPSAIEKKPDETLGKDVILFAQDDIRGAAEGKQGEGVSCDDEDCHADGNHW